jgi:chromosome segregation ATPase
MPYLENERARIQAEIQSADAETANLAAREQTQQQAAGQAQAQVTAAQSGLAALQAQRPSLEAAAAAADGRLATIDGRISQHHETEPEPFIERPNKPPLRNPEWTAWKRALDQLARQRNEAQASASAAHGRLNDLDRAIAQAIAEIQAAEARAAQAVATLAQLNEELSAARQRAATVRQKLEELTRWSDEIDREAMDRSALEKVASGLSARVLELEDAWAEAEAASAAADAALAGLIARRDELTAALTDVKGRIPAAEAEAREAELALDDLAAQIDSHITGGL